MSYQNVPQTSLPRVRTTFADWGVAYKVALGDIAFGVFMIVCGLLVGGVFHRGLMQLFTLLGVPEDRQFLPASEPQTGTELLAILGFYILAAGICIFCVRLVLELLGLAGEPKLTRRMRPPGKLALGTAAAGLVVIAAALFPETIFALFFLNYTPGDLSIVNAIWQAGGLLLICSPISLFLNGRYGRWTDAVGWGRIRWGWINRLSVALVVGGTITMIPFLPFDGVARAFASTGVAVLVLGIVPQLYMAGRP